MKRHFGQESSRRTSVNCNWGPEIVNFRFFLQATLKIVDHSISVQAHCARQLLRSEVNLVCANKCGVEVNGNAVFSSVKNSGCSPTLLASSGTLVQSNHHLYPEIQELICPTIVEIWNYEAPLTENRQSPRDRATKRARVGTGQQHSIEPAIHFRNQQHNVRWRRTATGPWRQLRGPRM
jgi:hypothetical protein